MRLLLIATLAISISLPLSAAPLMPTIKQIAGWSTDEINEMAPTVEKMVPVTLRGGEQAYLASVTYGNAGRNFWAGYLLIRPHMGQVRNLEEFGGQYNQIRLLDDYSASHSAVIIGSASSGQGVSEKNYSLIVFEGWSTKVLYQAEASDNSGNCGAFIERYCVGNNVFINILEEASSSKRLALVVTNVKYTSPDIETTPYQYSHGSEIVFLDNPNQ